MPWHVGRDDKGFAAQDFLAAEVAAISGAMRMLPVTAFRIGEFQQPLIAGLTKTTLAAQGYASEMLPAPEHA